MLMTKPELPYVTILVATRNEDKYISTCLDSLMDSDYPSDRFEVFVLDGKSEDKTCSLVEDYVTRFPNIRLFTNENLTLPYARNLGISLSLGDFIVNCDAHSLYPREYISKLIHYSIVLNADNVGGIWETVPANNKLISIAIAKIMSSIFGVGNAEYRIYKEGGDEYLKVDTVPYGCFRKSLFEKVGYYDVELTRNQDNELNERILKANGSIF